MSDIDAARGAGARELIFLEPIFLTKVWGGSRLHELFGFDLQSDRVGECLAVSARPEGDCRIRGGRFEGATLSQLWATRRDLFGGLPGDSFPLQVKLLDARQDLSVQVHPDAAYDATHSGGAGKNEAWYVVRAPARGQVLVGHSADTKAQFARMAAAGRWDDLLRHIYVSNGDFLYVPAGTVHAILAGSLFYEVQQPSDITYRLYDYDRLDGGAKRQLHVAEALDVVAAPSAPGVARPVVTESAGATRREFARAEHFAFEVWNVREAAAIPVEAPFAIVGVLEGAGTVNGVAVTAGDHFVVPAAVDALDVRGCLALALTTP